MTTSQLLDNSPRRSFTVDDVYRMVEAGILDEDEPLELIHGELLIMTPQGPRHISLKDDLRRRLERAYESMSAHMRDQGPLAISDDTHPEPDLAVIRGNPRDYLTAHPGGADALLVVELAWTSQARDRAKAAVYAFGGVADYWLLDLAGRALEWYSKPDSKQSHYQVTTRLTESESVTLPGLDVAWSIATMLP